MQEVDAREIIEEAIGIATEMNPQATDGTWLEDLTVQVGPYIKEWDIERCYLWSEWPEREDRFPDTTHQDVGIDAVGIRRSDGEYIAIQCKSRQLDEHGRGADITKAEIDKFANASAGDFWSERWIVTNGDNRPSGNALQVVSMHAKPIKMVNIASDLPQQQASFTTEECPHCEPNTEGTERRQSKSCMQTEAITESVRILKEHEQSESGGLPVGQARGKIILPCGTGKTRISLRIVEELTPPGDLSVVLCPSIALVAQIRREYLQNAAKGIRALAVCSDETAGYDPKKESSRNTAADPTVDNSNVSASEVKGKVTTDPAEIAWWIREREGTGQVSVVFGTYQSGHRIAEALQETGVTTKVLIADEAHRTAGLKRKQTKKAALSDEESRIRNFTLCHDQDEFPATYRVYQTATPRIYDTSKVDRSKSSEWIVRTMDDETVFGVDLYRKSYVEAVKNGWLADYRIIALGVNDPDAFAQANALASNTKSKGRRALTSADYLRGLAFALSMGGATQDRENGIVPIKSCIAFMNTVDKSKNMADDLKTVNVKQWVQKWLQNNVGNQKVKDYTMEHLDATSNVTARENAKRRLAEADEERPHSVINVGIFGEGTDSPSLNAVAFLESRKSPIDVIQAVGRAMRTAPGKEMGYIICPILIPPTADPERWLSTSNMDEGWQELGQILTALRAHDQRIEENLGDLLQLYIPKPPEVETTIVAVASGEEKRIQYREHEGPPGEAQEAVERVLNGTSTLAQEFRPILEPPPVTNETVATNADTSGSFQYSEFESGSAGELRRIGEGEPTTPIYEPTQIVTGKKNRDGSIELRMDTVARTQSRLDGTRGDVDIKKSKAKAKDMINKGTGIRLTTGSERKKRKTPEERAEHSAMQMLLLSGMEEHGNAIRMNLLAKSGLVDNRVVRDLNILEASVKEAAHHLQSDSLSPALDQHFGLNNLDEAKRKSQADGCTIAALLLMNAAMLHQRIANGRWLSGVSDLATLKNDVNVVRTVCREWERIMRHDFRPILEPALETIYAMESSGKTGGLERALRHIAAEAERIAETYADMGADHAGPLFNKVMGNQASDGAFFTRPVAASIAARLTLDACGEQDWTDPQVWREYKTVDLACGSGTLLAAMLTDMKRRAWEQGVGATQMANLQKLAVEDTIKGLDINPISLQLAASQLTAGNQEIRYRQMGLHLMPYGPQRDNPAQVSVGTLELLGQRAIVSRADELSLPDDKVASQPMWTQHHDAELEDAESAVEGAHIIIMNPPFTNRARMGEKFPKSTQQALRRRADDMENILVRADAGLDGFMDKNSIRPLFVGLADKCLRGSDGILTMINPTIALSTPSGFRERQILAQRYNIHTVLTGRWAREFTLSQNTEIDESIIVALRQEGPKPPTRFIHLDKMPVDESEVDDFHRCLTVCEKGSIANGWGEVSYWPEERIETGDWTAAIWRSPALAEAAWSYKGAEDLIALNQQGISPKKTGASIPAQALEQGASKIGKGTKIHVLASKGAEGQQTIEARPDSLWDISKGGPKRHEENEGHLLLTFGQRSGTGRLNAVASNERYIGVGWMPVPEVTTEEAKAVSVFMNSTAGRIQLMANVGKMISFPIYNPSAYGDIRVPDVKDNRIRQVLTDCWERTKDMTVPQFRDGECEVRCLWDEAVAEAMGWDPEELARLRNLLHNEPHVRGLGYNQYADEIEDEKTASAVDQETFKELADEWERDRPRGADIEQMTRHSAYQRIIAMGEPAVPWLLQRLAERPDHWFVALNAITGARPVPPESRGRIKEMTQAWLDWGRQQGYELGKNSVD